MRKHTAADGTKTTTDENPRVRPATAEDFRQLLQPVRQAILEAREKTGGIVFVVHNPFPEHCAMWRDFGIDVKPHGTAVFGMTCADAIAAFEQSDIATRRWLAQPPDRDSIKVFLIAGDGTVLLTLRFDKGTVWVSWEPEPRPN